MTKKRGRSEEGVGKGGGREGEWEVGVRVWGGSEERKDGRLAA